MIKSMTGYGKCSEEINKREYQIEIKSVNHRYLDISIKLPRQLNYLEGQIKKAISTKIKRGKIDVFFTFENYSEEGKERFEDATHISSFPSSEMIDIFDWRYGFLKKRLRPAI